MIVVFFQTQPSFYASGGAGREATYRLHSAYLNTCVSSRYPYSVWEVLTHVVFRFSLWLSYMYNVCPFHNITQKEERRAWNSFHGVLGWVGPQQLPTCMLWLKPVLVNSNYQNVHLTKYKNRFGEDWVLTGLMSFIWDLFIALLFGSLSFVPPLSTPTEFGVSGWLKMTPSRACCLQWEKGVAQETEKQRCEGLWLRIGSKLEEAWGMRLYS